MAITQTAKDYPGSGTTEVDQKEEPHFMPTQQEVAQITLSGLNLLFAMVIMCFSINTLEPILSSTLLFVTLLLVIIYRDYWNFLSLGPGGTPATFLGYMKISFLRLVALKDVYTPDQFPSRIFPATGYYQCTNSWVPTRIGPRPRIAGIAPQRQIDQTGCPKMYQVLCSSLRNIASLHPTKFHVGQSCFEKKGLALFATNPINTTCRGEIVHVHHSERSMHLNLHPDDAKIVLEKGWGERHPLAKGGWMTQFVPRTFVMIYAPRNQAELEVVAKIIEAAGFWVSGERFMMEVNGERGQ
ncbi:hypothetical protein HYFRA_00010284 [Hymenoscyphus fraxineus]|uniref:Luciferase domain-containing protein n=1 Tax=Hymenoscyphus fraxineus TaxID=746836 RepID=A0A9N9KW40_9HELO|nr:hypothetical protein HYFRA_00010284 [Hymenoscyphus fraxineus]